MTATVLYRALIDAGTAEELAEKAVEGLLPTSEVTTKTDIAEVKTDIARLAACPDETATKGKLAALRTDLLKWTTSINFIGWGVIIAAVGLISRL